MKHSDVVLGAASSAESKPASINPSFSGATFIQLWQTRSAQQQRAWLDAMHSNIHLLQVQPGYRSMSLHPSLDGRNLIVYAQWESQADLIAAVERPEVKAARNDLDSHGEPEGSVYSIDFVALPAVSANGILQIAPGNSPVTMVNMWAVDDRDKQGALLSAMKAEAAKIAAKSGMRGMVFHRGTDGKRVAVYAQWDSIEAFNRGIADDPTAIANRATLAQFGEPSANTYSVDSVYLPIAAIQTDFSE